MNENSCKDGVCSTEITPTTKTALTEAPATVRKPRYTSRYDEQAWEVNVSLPGVQRDDLTVSIENEILEIQGNRVVAVPESWKPLGSAPVTGAETNYRLRLDVGPEVDETQVSADLNDGMLTLRLPLREAAKPQKIEVR